MAVRGHQEALPHHQLGKGTPFVSPWVSLKPSVASPTPSHSSSSFGSFCDCRPHTHILSGATCKGGGEEGKKREKNFISYFPEERGLHPLSLCHMVTEEEQPGGPVTNAVAPSTLPWRANPAATTYANASLPQHSCLTDKNRPWGLFFLSHWLHLLGASFIYPHLLHSLSSKAQGKGCQTAAINSCQSYKNKLKGGTNSTSYGLTARFPLDPGQASLG